MPALEHEAEGTSVNDGPALDTEAHDHLKLSALDKAVMFDAPEGMDTGSLKEAEGISQDFGTSPKFAAKNLAEYFSASTARPRKDTSQPHRSRKPSPPDNPTLRISTDSPTPLLNVSRGKLAASKAGSANQLAGIKPDELNHEAIPDLPVGMWQRVRDLYRNDAPWITTGWEGNRTLAATDNRRTEFRSLDSSGNPDEVLAAARYTLPGRDIRGGMKEMLMSDAKPGRATRYHKFDLDRGEASNLEVVRLLAITRSSGNLGQAFTRPPMFDKIDSIATNTTKRDRELSGNASEQVKKRNKRTAVSDVRPTFDFEAPVHDHADIELRTRRRAYTVEATTTAIFNNDSSKNDDAQFVASSRTDEPQDDQQNVTATVDHKHPETLARIKPPLDDTAPKHSFIFGTTPDGRPLRKSVSLCYNITRLFLMAHNTGILQQGMEQALDVCIPGRERPYTILWRDEEAFAEMWQTLPYGWFGS
ncbi:hypothetical protein LTR66_017635 [Elasticomyces elasticus]|nr:hypothetical protein LTR66_017635 [Elasticomyces elasticus]